MPVEVKSYQTAGHTIATCIALAVLDIIVVALRFWTQRKMRVALKVDDWLVVIATVRYTLYHISGGLVINVYS